MLEINKSDLVRLIFLAAQKVYLPELIRVTPRASGETQDAWEIDIDGDNIVFLNPRGDIITFLEYGTDEYDIIPKKKDGVLAFEMGNKTVFAKKVHHPGIKARKFLDKLFKDKSIEKDFEVELEEQIKRHFEKQFKK